MWIKICGLTTSDAVTAALDAGADAIGFVFAAKSVRQVTPDVARRLAAAARGRARCVAVTRHPSQQEIDDIVSIFEPDVLQTDVGDLSNLRLPALLELLPVFRGDGNASNIASSAANASDAPLTGASTIAGGSAGNTAIGAASNTASPTLPHRLLFEGATSGAGIPCDWTAARAVARRTQLVLAGGLNPTNVAAAIAAVQPFGVDVSTGVEVRPGVKSPVEIANFVRAARESRVAYEDLV
jgi:phosphoribosylanthranilate isomerase